MARGMRTRASRVVAMHVRGMFTSAAGRQDKAGQLHLALSVWYRFV